MRVTFPPLEASHIEIVLGLMAQLYQQDAISWDEARARFGIATLLAHREHGGTWLIEADAEIAGYFVLTMCFSIEFHGRFALLDEFFIEDRWRGRGLGTKALDFIAQHCRAMGIEVVRLEVDRGNPRAQELYRRNGFVEEKRHLMTRFLLK